MTAEDLVRAYFARSQEGEGFYPNTILMGDDALIDLGVNPDTFPVFCEGWRIIAPKQNVFPGPYVERGN